MCDLFCYGQKPPELVIIRCAMTSLEGSASAFVDGPSFLDTSPLMSLYLLTMASISSRRLREIHMTVRLADMCQLSPSAMLLSHWVYGLTACHFQPDTQTIGS